MVLQETVNLVAEHDVAVPGLRLAIEPVRKKIGDYPLADTEATAVGADRDNLAAIVGKRDPRPGHVRQHALKVEHIVKVDRRRQISDDDLSSGGRRYRPLDQSQGFAHPL